MVSILENVYDVSIAVLLLASLFYVRQMKRIKRDRGLTAFELIMYYIIQTAIILWIISFLLLNYVL
ncbi:hypothetical protein [Evansella tamaricis]|uniref:Uncharacterized protein n=1 Tax=Evansella tamaricis TaxID=2069301 RepID=A0ABS6JGM8_9BACI|nr:hypothetical protein [Evansella tamaricis]MBU9711997.1 hypothetical protein [Evansella tamaricis]